MVREGNQVRGGDWTPLRLGKGILPEVREGGPPKVSKVRLSKVR